MSTIGCAYKLFAKFSHKEMHNPILLRYHGSTLWILFWEALRDEKVSYLLCTVMLLFLLAACGQDSAENQGSGITEPEVAASDEIVIKATDYEFDQPEYRIKKECLYVSYMRMQKGTTELLYPVLASSLIEIQHPRSSHRKK